MATYTVQPGDSMWRIAVKFQIGVSEIIQANPQIKNPAMIYPGEQLNIPTLDATKAIEQQVINLTNQYRIQNGLPALTANWQLSRVARFKAEDMRDKNYVGHISPTYGSPFEMMRAFGITFTHVAEENIAAGQPTPQEVVNAWINDPPHRQNILNAEVTQIGVGYAQGGTYGHYWSQMFIG